MLRKRSVLLLAIATGLVAAAFGYRVGVQNGLDLKLRQPIAESGSRLERTFTIPDADERAMRLVELFAELGPADLPAVEVGFERAMPFVDPVAIVLFAEWWTRFDPQAAFEASTRWPLNDPNLGFLTVMRAWARRDPVGARLAFESIEHPPRREAALLALAQGWSEFGDDQGLTSYLERVQRGRGRQKAIDVLASTMVARRGIDATLEFAEGLPDDGANRFKLHVYRRVATAVTRVDPARGAAWAAEQADGPFGDTILRLVGTTWVRQDPDAAITWLRSLPKDEPRARAIREAYRQWLTHDRAAALAWLPRTGASPELDPAVELYAVAIGFEDPLVGFDWAARIEDPDLRERATVNVGRVWMELDPKAAGAWLDAANLPSLWKQRIMGEDRRRRPTPKRESAS